MKAKSDEALNPQLATEMQSLRGDMRAAAELETPLPPQFSAKQIEGEAAMEIVDTATGLTVRVPLYQYGGARRVLATLFPAGGAPAGLSPMTEAQAWRAASHEYERRVRDAVSYLGSIGQEACERDHAIVVRILRGAELAMPNAFVCLERPCVWAEAKAGPRRCERCGRPEWEILGGMAGAVVSDIRDALHVLAGVAPVVRMWADTRSALAFESRLDVLKRIADTLEAQPRSCPRCHHVHNGPDGNTFKRSEEPTACNVGDCYCIDCPKCGCGEGRGRHHTWCPDVAPPAPEPVRRCTARVGHQFNDHPCNNVLPCPTHPGSM